VDLFAGLNPNQQDAVRHVDGPVLVVAGAGSGKTRVLTHRIAHLITEHHVHPSSILAITFTNKAASEMAHRVADLVGDEVASGMWVTTFHKTCVRILRRDIPKLGYQSSFSIYDATDAKRLITQISRDLNIDEKRLPPRAIQQAISRAKDELIDFDTFTQNASGWPDEQIASVYQQYDLRLKRANALDFDDLITKTVELFSLYDDVLGAWQNHFSHLMIDEYQDTNRAQYHLVNLLAKRRQNVMVVGDPQQGIYAFRGATVRNITDFETDYPNTTVITLAQNYRSTQTILSCANALIGQATDVRRTDLWTENPNGSQVVRYHASDEHDEAEFVARTTEELLRTGVKRNDIAVFYRTNAQSRVVEDVFVRLRTPYRVIGGVRFYERQEIKDVLAYAKLLVNPADDISAIRVVNTPRRGVGNRTVDVLRAYQLRHDATFMDACRHAHTIGLTARAAASVDAFVNIVDLLRTTAVNGATVSEVLKRIMDDTGYRKELEQDGTQEALSREENLRELRSVAHELFERGIVSDGLDGLAAFLDTVALVNDVDALDDDEEDDRVTLMTLHTAKGLEFPVVFILGLEDGVLPHVRSLQQPTELAEERRLAYVGMTRAQQQLYLCHAEQRTLWGGTSYNPPSRFLDPLPEHLVDAHHSDRNLISRAQNHMRLRSNTVTTRPASRASRASQPERRPAPQPATDDVFRRGDTVMHPRFGTGTIIAIDGDEASIRFDDGETKHLLLAYAPIVKC